MPSRNDLIPGLDIHAAISTHLELSTRLRALIDGQSREALKAATVSSDSQCALGKWIHGRAALRYAALSEFGSLRDAHAQFHSCAGNALEVHQQGNQAAARALHNGALRQATDAFRRELSAFCKAAARSAGQNRRELALASAKISRKSVESRMFWILLASVGATAALRGILAGDVRASVALQVRPADVLMLLAVACPALYWFVLHPLLRTLDHLAYVKNDLRIADATMEIRSPMLIADPNGLITKVNRAFTESTGFSPDEVAGNTPRLLKSDKQDAAFFAEMWKSLELSGTWYGTLWNKRKDGREFLADLTITAIRGEMDELVAYVSTFTDLTAQRGGLLAREPAATPPESAAHLRSEFLGHMGHELRTPMNAVLGYADLALHEPLDEKLRGYLQQIRDSGRTLMKKIDHVLDFSKIESGTIEFETRAFDLAAVCTGAFRNAILLASGRKVGVESDIDRDLPSTLLGDPARVEQIVATLLGNAIKYTGSGGKVMLSVKLHRLSQGMASIGIMVQDTGIGMDAARIAVLFEPFAPAGTSATRKQGGTGLGLTIAKSLVEQMGGTLGVESAPGKGSTFHAVLMLPVAAKDADTATPPPIPASAAWDGIQVGRYAGKRLLVAEDDEDNQGLARVVFECFGFSVDIAENGREAVRMVSEAREPYDLILMDIRMPEMGGLEATRIIRATHPMESLPIVALSANAYEADRQKSLNAGMNEHLVKPLELNQINQVLERILG